MKRVLLTLVILFVLLAGMGIAAIYTGAYDVSAIRPEGPLAAWAMSTMMDNSVKRHADNIAVPGLEDSALVRVGFEHYREMCVTCHGSPAGGRTEIGRGLNPPAPDLSEAAGDWKPGELYWIIKNGIRMTGMPAFGPTHDENELWAMVAFVRKLPGMSAEQYKTFTMQSKVNGENTMQEAEESNHQHGAERAHN